MFDAESQACAKLEQLIIDASLADSGMGCRRANREAKPPPSPMSHAAASEAESNMPVEQTQKVFILELRIPLK